MLRAREVCMERRFLSHARRSCGKKVTKQLMNKTRAILVFSSVIALSAILLCLSLKHPNRPDAALVPTAVMPAATIPPKVIAPAPVREIPASATQAMHKALAERQERLQQVSEPAAPVEPK